MSKCYRCFRPEKSCYCKYIKSFDCGVKFVLLMHPKEAFKQKTGTGRLTNIALIDSEIIIGVDFTENKRLKELLSDESYYPVLLYPDENAWTASNPALKNELGTSKKLLVIVLDATWPLAKKMLKLSPNLHEIPKISFRAGYRSQFKFKKQPAEECLSSIESCYYLIKELQTNDVVKIHPENAPQVLLDVFSRMVEYQLESHRQREEAGIPNRYVRSENAKMQKETQE